jgi:ABC-2 type transport system ATP-binding protein
LSLNPAHKPALSVQGLSFRYGPRTALDGVSFQVPAGRFTALLGPNGAGKSTLFSLLTRLLVSDEGVITINGSPLARQPRQALAALGVVFQEPTLDLDLTVIQNLRYFARLQGITPRQAEQRIEQELNRLALWERRGEKARALNGGHRRRVEIARALIHRPALLILDEPTVGLDPPTRRDLVAHVHQLCEKDGMAVLWATHLIDEVRPHQDRLIILHRGKVCAEGEADQVITHGGATSADTEGLSQAFAHYTADTAGAPA